MKKLDTELQATIHLCDDLYDVEDELTGWGLEWYTKYSFEFRGKSYSFHLIDSGKSDEPQYGNYPEVKDLKQINE